MSGRIRSIKPEFNDDEKLGAMCPLDRLMFASSWLLADDYGNFRANPKWIKSHAFCYDDSTSVEDVRESVSRLVETGMFVSYSVRGQRYIHVKNWNKHQKVDKPGKPHCPGPEEHDCSVTDDVGAFRETLAKVRETFETIREGDENPPETLAPDRDQDQDQEGRGPRPREAVAAARNQMVSCPRDLRLTDEQASSIRMDSGIPSWAIEQSTTDFIANFIADPSDKRQLVHWQKCLSKAVIGAWRDPKKRPRKPEEPGESKTVDAASLGLIV